MGLTLLFGVFALGLIAGAPVAFAIGLAAVACFAYEGLPLFVAFTAAGVTSRCNALLEKLNELRCLGVSPSPSAAQNSSEHSALRAGRQRPRPHLPARMLPREEEQGPGHRLQDLGIRGGSPRTPAPHSGDGRGSEHGVSVCVACALPALPRLTR